MSEPYSEDNLLDRISDPDTLAIQYEHTRRREREILSRRLPLAGGHVLSVGCGWNPGRHLFPSPAFRMTGVELEEEKVRALVDIGRLDEGLTGRAGELPLPDSSYDVVLYRLVLHHLVFQGPLGPVFDEAWRLLRPGGALIAVEPGSWHPVGMGLALANQIGIGTLVHGTPDDIPLSPRRLRREALRGGFEPELHAVTYTWRRMPPAVQRALRPLDAVGSRPRARAFGHTLMLIGRKGGALPATAVA